MTDLSLDDADLKLCETHGAIYDARHADECAACSIASSIEATRAR